MILKLSVQSRKSFQLQKGWLSKLLILNYLNKTGGIVQGMSGSPIIQNGKVIGAVTHVFVNDPTSGYGVHIEWMLNEAGINIYERKKKKQVKRVQFSPHFFCLIKTRLNSAIIWNIEY